MTPIETPINQRPELPSFSHPSTQFKSSRLVSTQLRTRQFPYLTLTLPIHSSFIINSKQNSATLINSKISVGKFTPYLPTCLPFVESKSPKVQESKSPRFVNYLPTYLSTYLPYTGRRSWVEMEKGKEEEEEEEGKMNIQGNNR